MDKQKIKILLVDDARPFVDALVERLKIRGFEARGVYDAASALEAVSESTDVMLLEPGLPGMDGLEVLSKVKREHPEIHVIMLAGHGTDDVERKATKLGAYCFFRKPISFSILLDTIRIVCSGNDDSAMHLACA